MKLTKENLIKFGMKETNNPMFPLQKYIFEDEYGNDVSSICVTQINNTPQLCILTLNDIVYINPSTIEELQIIEKSIVGIEEQE